LQLNRDIDDQVAPNLIQEKFIAAQPKLLQKLKLLRREDAVVKVLKAHQDGMEVT
jgi:hypothetical protein